jgi:DNA-binding LacI/PurR family transcriptional regulator
MTIGEIAHRCGVSRSTVSYALSGKRPVAEATRQRIVAVADELGYYPASAARPAESHSTGTVGLIVPPAGSTLTPMQLDFVGAVAYAAAQAGLDVLLSASAGGPGGSFDRIVTPKRIDGVILMEVRLNDARVEQLRRARIPFVTIGRTAEPGGTSWVDLDTGTLVSRCVDHLADLGHRCIALINRPAALLLSGYAPAHRASLSFARATARRGAEGVEFRCADEEKAGEICMDRILAARPKVTAAVTINEAALPGLERALERAGLELPNQFSITGLVADRWAERCQTRLTAFDVPAGEMGATAVRLLRERITRPGTAPAHALLAPPIAVRESTGPAVARR